MLYFKNQQLTSTYRVALNTVLNWIKAAQSGKLNLELTKVGERYYIANTAQNVTVIERLVEERKKYRNSRTSRVITPSPKIYELFDEREIADLISNLDNYREIPLQYTFFEHGADIWDDYAARMAKDQAPNLLTQTVKLLDINTHYLDEIISGYAKVNVVDIGPGNGYPVASLLRHLLDKGVLNKYIALDDSRTMLDLAEHNIRGWIPDDFVIESHIIDIAQDRFGPILLKESLNERSGTTINLILCLGGTIENLRNPAQALKVIQQSMGRNDVFISTSKLDTLQSRRFFDFSTKPNGSSLSARHRMLLDRMGFDPTWYEVEMGFDSHRNQRFIQVRLAVAVRINFTLPGGVRSVQFEKGDSILLWRSWQLNSLQVVERLHDNGFYALLVSQTSDREYLLTLSRIKTESD